MSSEVRPITSNEKSVSGSITGYFTPALKPVAAITSSIASGALYVVRNFGASAKNLVTGVVSHVPTSIRENAKENNGKANANKNEQSIQPLKTNEATAEHKAREKAENALKESEKRLRDLEESNKLNIEARKKEIAPLKEEAHISSVVKAETVTTQSSHLTIIGNEILPISPLEQDSIIRTGEIAQKELEERHGSSMSSSLRNFKRLWQINSSTQQSAIKAGELAKKQLEERQKSSARGFSNTSFENYDYYGLSELNAENNELDPQTKYEKTVQKVIIFCLMALAILVMLFTSPTPDELTNICFSISNLDLTLSRI